MNQENQPEQLYLDKDIEIGSQIEIEYDQLEEREDAEGEVENGTCEGGEGEEEEELDEELNRFIQLQIEFMNSIDEGYIEPIQEEELEQYWSDIDYPFHNEFEDIERYVFSRDSLADDGYFTSDREDNV